MKASEYIIDKSNELVMLFPNIRVRYDFDKEANTHFVEVVPSEIHKGSEEYKNTEEEITIEFIHLFPDEGICFISDDALVGIDKVDYEAVGEQCGNT
jgi:hypothetical protein